MGLDILFILCLIFSAFFSGIEMAFISTSEVYLRGLADQGNRAAEKLLAMKADSQKLLSALLIGNNIVNTGAAAILTYWFKIYFGWESEMRVTIVLAPFLILFCELIPKDLGRVYHQEFLLKTAWLLQFVTRILHWPVRFSLGLITLGIPWLRSQKSKSIFVSEQELRSLLDESAKTGILERHEKQLIDMILDFERICVEQVMIPFEEVAKISIQGTIREVKEIARKTHTRMFIVYEEIPSITVGIVNVFDLLFESEESQPLKKYLRAPVFLPKGTSIEMAFLTLQQKRQSSAVVTDERGEVAGVVFIEKLLAVERSV